MRSIAVAVLFLHVATVNSVNQRTNNMRSKSGSKDFREVFVPPTMLILSSPMERKVSYTQIKNFKSVGSVLPILDAGFIAPYGVAWDSDRSALYICDGDLRKIFRVKLAAVKCQNRCFGMDYHLKVVGNRYTVVENVIAQWVTVDPKGNLFFTDQETNSVNKLPVEFIDMIIRDELLPKNLGKTTEPENEGEEAAVEAISPLLDENATKKAEPPPPPPPRIYQLYETKVCKEVGTPAGVVAEGEQLFWTNQVGGFSSGSIAEGKTKPKVKQPPEGEADGAPSFPSFKLANNTGSAYGIALTPSKILYTDTSHKVYAVSRGTGEVVALTANLLKPRGIVYDGDNTAYIADEEGNNIVSIPVGLLKEGAPVTTTVDIHAPFGLAMLGSDDPIWNKFKDDWSGAHHVASPVMLLLALATLLASLF